MKFVCNRLRLNEVLRLVQMAVGDKSLLPIFQTIKITAFKDRMPEMGGEGKSSGKLWLHACNLNFSIRVITEADVQQEGSIALPEKYLVGMVKEMNGENLEMSCFGYKAVLTSGHSRGEIMGMPADEFPNIEEEAVGVLIRIKGERLHTAIQRTQFSVGSEEAGYKLNGLFVEAEGNQVRFVSTDGLRLSLMELEVETRVEGGVTAYLPLEVMRTVERGLSDTDQAEMIIGEKRCKFVFGDVLLVSNLLDARFPPYASIVPRQRNFAVRIPRDPFVQSLRLADAAEAGLESRIRTVRMKVKENELVTIGESEGKNLAMNKMAIEYGGGEFSVKYNLKHLLDLLSVLTGDWLRFEFTEPQKPVVIRDEVETNYLHVLAPLKEEGPLQETAEMETPEPTSLDEEERAESEDDIFSDLAEDEGE